MKQTIKCRIKTCDRFLKHIKNKPEYKETYHMFRAIRLGLAKKKKAL